MLEEIFSLLQKGEFEKAKLYADKIESAVDRHNVLGIIFYQQGKIEEALNHFKKALESNPTHDDALFNYAKVLFEKQDYFESWRHLTRINQKNWEVYDFLGDTQLKQSNPAMALQYYRKACDLDAPEQMKQKFEEAKRSFRRSEKIAIFCLPGLDNFIKDIAQILSNIYEVKLVVTTDGRQIQEAYNWADTVWLEWANEMAVEITNKLPKAGKRIFCRLHSYEALANYPEQINWKNVDKLILVAEHIKNILKDYHPKVYEQIKDKTVVVPNGLDLNKFVFKIRQPGFNIAVVAHINHKKDPAMWLQVMGILRKIDERYILHVAGDFQEIRYANYFKHFIKDTGLEKSVKLHGWVDDVNVFLEDKNYLLSTSIHEGHPYNIAEAMARGIKPIIHNYAGSKAQWPNELIYDFISDIPCLLSEGYDSASYRNYIENHWALELQISSILENTLSGKDWVVA
ncbi:MAG TPA: tetratricopeptide repeat protein [Pseudothermotoga sp.]|nr:tetratricopeptide repeat protein [Pseudothermotoga sp.]HOK84227.1 tetratricopeptide repeat protein [Pseudothermotoga sp.]HPP71108.1 tetratricopeptide repeat protein [Pseudothermotoga sp.]